ncbi:hypothetical protein [Nonomuraea rubra]|uniref:Uncharacterized protein n=1 Tax=Nonomuraea rubra TaxID=46180 RepID=A0A7X0P6L3_9ACTN|nr:hypothetical protein [Nonomuraea rubra]MBB6556227.1 hypothetical protein [Nonomuraea rubra]
MNVANLAVILDILNAATAGTWMLAAALVVLILIAVAAVHVRDRRRARHQHEQDGRDIHPPTRLDQLLRDEVGDEADRLARQWEQRQDGGR